jgi:cobalamin-dependent methionine synthase I
VGPEPEKLARELLDRGDYLEAYITDLSASALVDSVAACVHEDIRREADRQGNKVTNRYSPGYCSWDVAEQQKLFSLFPENTCGISLSESSLMSPVKSISGIIGTGPRVKFNEYTCEICPMKTCTFRKTTNQL